MRTLDSSSVPMAMTSPCSRGRDRPSSTVGAALVHVRSLPQMLVVVILSRVGGPFYRGGREHIDRTPSADTEYLCAHGRPFLSLNTVWPCADPMAA